MKKTLVCPQDKIVHSTINICYSLFTIHFSPFIIHHSPFIIRYSKSFPFCTALNFCFYQSMGGRREPVNPSMRGFPVTINAGTVL